FPHQFWNSGDCPDTSVAAFYVPDDERFGVSYGNDCIPVDPAPTEMQLESSNNPSVFRQEVTFTATVSALPPGGGTPTGTVFFLDGNTPLGQAELDQAGQARFATANLSVGRHQISAIYRGTANYVGSSATLLQTVLAHGPAARFLLEAPATVAVNS